MSVVLKGDRLRQEEKDLLNDKLIFQMFYDLKFEFGVDIVNEYENNHYHFMSACLKRYQDLGGKNAKSIGGPSDAVYKLATAGR